jgi:hypothetical protein
LLAWPVEADPMNIVRQDSDMLVLEATPPHGGKLERVAAVIVFLSLAAGMAAVVRELRWWNELESPMRWIVGLSSAAGFLTLANVICKRSLEPVCLAFDRSSRRVLCIRKTWGRTYRDEFHFDQVQCMTLEEPLPLRGASWSLYLKVSHGPAGSRITIPIATALWTDPLDGIAAAIDAALGREPTSVPQCKSPFSWALRFAFGGGAVCYAIFAGPGHFEKWQSASWPTADGAVEVIQVSKKPYDTHRKGSRFVLADAVEIVYRYSVDGVQYRATRFNLRQNWLTPQEAPHVAEDYRPGRACQVAFHPGSPAQSFLTTDGADAFFADVKFDAAIGLAGLAWIAWNVWRITRRPDPAAGDSGV